MSQLELAPGFSMANAAVCIGASLEAYTLEPTISTPLMRARITTAGVPGSGQRATVLAFRGTASVRDFITDAEFRKVPLAGFEVHYGFREAYAAIIGLLEEWEGWGETSNPKSQTPSLPIIVTGHSLGGALAMLCAWALERAGFPIHSVYTFGGPRVGNGNWARQYDGRFLPDKPSLGERTWRCVNQEDPVPRLPGVLMRYRHAGREVFFASMGSVMVEPPLWFKLVSDAIGLWLKYRQGLRLKLCHPAERYREEIERRSFVPEILTAENAKNAEREEPFCALPKL